MLGSEDQGLSVLPHLIEVPARAVSESHAKSGVEGRLHKQLKLI